MLTAWYESSTTSLDHIDPEGPLMDPVLSPFTIDPMWSESRPIQSRLTRRPPAEPNQIPQPPTRSAHAAE